MKDFLLIFLLFIFESGFSQNPNFQYPNIKKGGKNIIDFLPTNWVIRDSIASDFNKDSLKDWAFVIEAKKPLKFEDTVCFSTQDFYPKILIIVLKQKDGSLVKSISVSKLFGSCNWGVQGGDPFQELKNRNSTLGITFLTGGTLRNWMTYYFRLQSGTWYLIGSESLQYWAGHTDGEDAFYNEKHNYLTGVIEIYNENQKKKRTNCKKIFFNKAPLIKLLEFEDETPQPFNGS